MANGKDPVTLKVGVLAVQGGFFEHKAALLKALKYVHKLNKYTEIEIIEVREKEDLQELDGLILPGGESTTMSIFLESSGLDSVLKEWMNDKTKPKVVWGTCAGLILMSNQIEGQKEGGQAKVNSLHACIFDGSTLYLLLFIQNISLFLILAHSPQLFFHYKH